MHNDIQQISHEYEEIMKKSKLGREKFDGYKAKYTKLKADVEPKIAELKAQLAKIQKDIDIKLYQKYGFVKTGEAKVTDQQGQQRAAVLMEFQPAAADHD